MQRSAYHRSYRHLVLPEQQIGRTILSGTLVSATVLLFGPNLVHLHAEWVLAVAQWIGIPLTRARATAGHITFPVADVSTFSGEHSMYCATIAIAALVCAILMFARPRRFRPGPLILGLFTFVTAVSGAYCFLAGSRFPYSIAQFVELWTRAEFILWVFIPLLFGIALAPLPLTLVEALLYTCTAILYSIWFSVVRLAMLIGVFHLAGIVWMVPSYFILGFLIDFMYVVAIYSRAICKAAAVLREDDRLWQW